MKHNRSIQTLIAGVTLLSLSTFSLAADEPSLTLDKDAKMKHETTGVIGGAVIGGLLGGPVGAIATAAFGGWVSDKTIAKKENALLNIALAQQNQDLIALQAEYRALEARYQVASRESRAAGIRNASFEAQRSSVTGSQALSDCCNDTELSLHFKTNSISIEPLYDDKLGEFVSLVNSMPKATIALTGHADRRGDSAKNLGLSQRRVQAVESKLKQLGLASQAIQTNAFGESRPQTGTDSFEDNFFDRRVVLKILSAGNELLTRSSD